MTFKIKYENIKRYFYILIFFIPKGNDLSVNKLVILFFIEFRVLIKQFDYEIGYVGFCCYCI